MKDCLRYVMVNNISSLCPLYVYRRRSTEYSRYARGGGGNPVVEAQFRATKNGRMRGMHVLNLIEKNKSKDGGVVF